MFLKAHPSFLAFGFVLGSTCALSYEHSSNIITMDKQITGDNLLTITVNVSKLIISILCQWGCMVYKFREDPTDQTHLIYNPETTHKSGRMAIWSKIGLRWDFMLITQICCKNFHDDPMNNSKVFTEITQTFRPKLTIRYAKTHPKGHLRQDGMPMTEWVCCIDLVWRHWMVLKLSSENCRPFKIIP